MEKQRVVDKILDWFELVLPFMGAVMATVITLAGIYYVSNNIFCSPPKKVIQEKQCDDSCRKETGGLEFISQAGTYSCKCYVKLFENKLTGEN